MTRVALMNIFAYSFFGIRADWQLFLYCNVHLPINTLMLQGLARH